ncbi:MAG: thiamine pyrophosphate-requiring protein [Alicyclobacillus sp.]|nr:thiamine pyrophosphate-requiring protein [Alicyclobacillus sp.]
METQQPAAAVNALSLASSLDDHPRTASDVLFETLASQGVEYVFANLGSDHPAIIESFAKAAATGRPIPKVVTCPHEMVALSAAHGYAQVTGRPQAVLVHVDVGTQNLGGALHNAARGRVPVFILAGMSPVTLDGERAGSRNEFIHYLQDVHDQRSFVREVTKWTCDVHAGDNIDLIVKRGLQMACSQPQGPVYVMAPREVLEQPVSPALVPRDLPPARPSGLPPEAAREIAEALANARFPLILTSYLGRNLQAYNQLVQLASDWSVAVMEAGPYYANFPGQHPMYLGIDDYVTANPFLEQADLVLVFDADLPWLPQKSRMQDGAKLYWIDCDPLKSEIPLWYYSGQQAFAADAAVALAQIRDALHNIPRNESVIAHRRARISQEHERIFAHWASLEQPSGDRITPEWLTACIRELLDENTLVVNETISNYGTVWRHLTRTRPASFFGSGASSLGWHGGAAIGVKLAHPEKTVIALTGDGSYLFSVPSSVHWVARRYQAPFLTVIYNNGGWKSPMLSTLAVHPHGAAKQLNDFHVRFAPYGELEKVAEAMGGALGLRVSTPDEVRPALAQALNAVRNGQSAVVNVILDPI